MKDRDGNEVRSPDREAFSQEVLALQRGWDLSRARCPGDGVVRGEVDLCAFCYRPVAECTCRRAAP